jgi:hypothetical protein
VKLLGKPLSACGRFKPIFGTAPIVGGSFCMKSPNHVIWQNKDVTAGASAILRLVHQLSLFIPPVGSALRDSGREVWRVFPCSRLPLPGMVNAQTAEDFDKWVTREQQPPSLDRNVEEGRKAFI